MRARTLLSSHDALLHYREVKRSTIHFASELFPSIFKSCALSQSMEHGAQLHADAVKLGFDSFTSTTNSIMSFYIKCDVMESAVTLFDVSVNKDSITWNALIHSFFSRGDYGVGLELYRQAKVHDFRPNVSTLVLGIQACWKLDAAEQGLGLHGLVVKNGYFTDGSIQNSLLSMYGKFQDLKSAQNMFDEMPDRDVVSWSALIGAYAQSERALVALQLFREMFSKGAVEMDALSVVSVLQACSIVGDINQGRLIHGLLIRRGFEADIFVGNSIVDMYSKCLDVDSAYIAFNMMTERNIVSWNSILSGLVHSEKYLEALELFDSMKKVGVESDEVTLVTMLQLCKKLGQAMWCKCIHAMVIRKLYLSNILLLNSLLDAYAKCDLVFLASKLFERMDEKNVITWSTMVTGCAHCGKPCEAIAFFIEMQQEFGRPNSVTMLSLIEACTSSVELKLSKCAHGVAVRNCFAYDLAVATALLDMYAKCGDLDSSRQVFEMMPERNVLTWNVMIGALGMNGHALEALALLDVMVSENVEPNGVTMLAVLSACSHGGLVKEGLSCFERMTQSQPLRPQLEHYSCIIDMLARAGDLEGATEIIQRMPEQVKSVPAAWGALLSACRSHGNYELGQGAASRVLELEPSNSAGYLLALSLYAKGGLVEDSANMRLLMKEKGVKIMSGYSLVHVGQRCHKFVSWDGSHPESREIYSMVELLHCYMKWICKNDLPNNLGIEW
ncbi:pentatricopeptide repeat-containing protein At2g17210 [Typha latifolia]|uniref:pentatricopeptide repeat-containing protein At2g17210 n=1 Tax=Typha latifolia TaxID=4733 RepID=UPI003C2E4D52